MSESKHDRGPLHREGSSVRARRRHLDLFLTHLQDVPLTAWVDAVRRRTHRPEQEQAAASLRAALQELRDPQLQFAAREAVLSQLQRFDGVEGRSIPGERRGTRHMRSETERAALAVLTRDRLSPSDFALLYEVFEPLIPAALLFGIDEADETLSSDAE